MAKDQTVKVRIEAEDRASATVRKVDDAVEDLADGLGGEFVVGAAAATAALAGAVALMNDSVAAASKSAAIIKQLGNALADLGPKGAQVTQALVDQASALQKVTQFGDDEIIQGQALAASFVKSEEALKALIRQAVALNTRGRQTG